MVDILLIILGISALAMALFTTIRPFVPGAVLAYSGLWLFSWSGIIHPSTMLLTSWGVATGIVVAIELMLPIAVAKATNGMGYIAVGALAGTIVGMVGLNYGWMIVGAAAGSLLGCMAYSRTPSGQRLRFPSSQFIQYLCAKGLPTVVTMSMIGISIMLIILENYPEFALERL